jgi:hypothetical protein
MADKSSNPYLNRKSLVDAREYGGNDLLIRLNWTVAADANGDRIFMCELPLNCQVVDGAICWDAPPPWPSAIKRVARAIWRRPP